MRQSRPVVITNDDGIDAPGLRALAAAVGEAWGEAPYIVAPDRCYSACSQQVTMRSPIAVQERGPREFAVGGSPADCARLAKAVLVPDCALLLAGINHGGNMGHDVFLSGTVGAAREAVLLGLPAIAISQYLRGGLPVDWLRSARWAVAVIRDLLKPDGGGMRLWNINLPHLETEGQALPAVTRCRPCSRPLPIAYTREDGAYRYNGGLYHTRPQDAGTDVSVCFGGAIAVSALPATLDCPAD